MAKVDFKAIEEKWQKRWEEQSVFVADDKSSKPRYYVLEMFPYPSGSGLHMGHAWNYTIGDILARFKIMNGFNVLHPMGYDALGLPAENAAIQAGSHPEEYNKNSIQNYIKQQKALGLTYDWSRILSTDDPKFYKWDQWIFLKMLEKGLAYQKESAVNWCPKCNTVLANEQVQNGKCWRHEDTDVEVKHLKQWFLKITDYADELYENLDNMDWPDRTKSMQKHWIGKSYGTEIDFEVESKVRNVVVVHGANSSEAESKSKKWGLENTRHWFPWLRKELGKKNISFSNELYPKDWNPDYEEWKKLFEKNEINENTIVIGHSLGCGFLLRWFAENKRKVKKLILVAPYVLDSPELPGLKEMVNFDFDSSLDLLWDELIVFSSEDDKNYILNSAKEINKKLNSRHISFKDKGHFTKRDLGTEEFPELLDEILSNEKWPVFTTRPDTIFGVTFVVVSAQHKKLWDLVTDEQKSEVEKFLKKIGSVSEKDMADLEKEGVFTGSYAVNPANGEKVPIYAGNFVVADYGSGMVMAVPAHDKRDFEFANKYGIEIKQVIAPSFLDEANPPKEGVKDTERNIIHALLMDEKEEKFVALKNKKLPWLTPITGSVDDGENFVDAAVREIKEETGYQNFELVKEMNHKLHAKFYAAHKEVNRSVISNIFVFKLKDDSRENLSEEEDLKHEVVWLPVSDLHKLDPVAELPEILNWFNNGEQAYTGKGVLIHSGEFDGLESDDAKKKITEWLEGKGVGRSTLNFRLRDWGISRQRYWGTPIPIIHCEKCGAVPVPEKDLPVVLPKDVKFGKGNPLETNEEWINVDCPKCGGKGKREVETMDTFVNSSWYMFRYCDSNNDDVIFDKEKVKLWCPVDSYIGGAEHACMHLIYTRFYTKFLRDIGLVDFDEPAINLFHQGMLMGEGGIKMSKSKGNVVLPETVSEKYGIDTARFFLSNLASPDKDIDWSDKGIIGSLRFMKKILRFVEEFKEKEDSEEVEVKLNNVIKNVTDYYGNYLYRKATIEIRELFDLIIENGCSRETLMSALKLLSPICPHVTEELWEKLGGEGFISVSEWPSFDENKLKVKKKEVDLNAKVVESVGSMINGLEGRGEKIEKVYLYVIPFELSKYNVGELSEKFGKVVEVYSVKDSEKYDPQGKSKKARPGQPGVFFE